MITYFINNVCRLRVCLDFFVALHADAPAELGRAHPHHAFKLAFELLSLCVRAEPLLKGGHAVRAPGDPGDNVRGDLVVKHLCEGSTIKGQIALDRGKPFWNQTSCTLSKCKPFT